MTAKSILIKDIMIAIRASVRPSDAVSKAVSILLENEISGIPVTDDQHQIVGFISEQDCLKHMVSDAYYHDQSAVVADVMSKSAFFVEPNESLFAVADLMCGNKPKIIPVVENGKLLGEVTRHEVIKALYKINQ